MRQIKFRVWDTNNSEWCDGCWVYESGELDHDTMTRSSLKGCVVQQFSGLFDKNGREIFEGDIVWASYQYPCDEEDWESTKNLYKIEWARSSYGGKIGFELIVVEPDGYSDFYGGWPDSNDIKVVGNVFENSDLLKQ